MKKIALFAALALLFVCGCGNAETAQTEQIAQTEQTVQTAQGAAAPDAQVPAQGESAPETAEKPAAQSVVAMTDSAEILGTVWYYATGTAQDSFTVNGQTVEATPVDAAGTVYKWSETAAAGQVVYGTVNVPYADFFYGELNTVEPVIATVVDTTAGENATLDSYREAGVYDAVTSATAQKWQQQSGTYTQSTGSGGQILGVAGFCLAVDADLYVNASVLSLLGVDAGTALQDFVAAMTLADGPAAVYKTLYADGTLSAVAAAETAAEGSFSLSSGGRYGDFELRADNVRVSGTILGVVLVTDNGRYALLHLENIWGNGRELAWRCFSSDKTGNGRFIPYEDIPGSTITEIRYITDQGVTVYSGLSIAVGE